MVTHEPVFCNCKDLRIKLCSATELCGMTFIYGMSVGSRLASRCHDSKGSCAVPVFQIAGSLEKNAPPLTGSHCISKQTSILFGQAPGIGGDIYFHSWRRQINK